MTNNKIGIPKLRFPGFTEPWEQRKFGEVVKTHPFRKYIADPIDNGDYKIIQQGDNPVLGYADGNPFKNFRDVILFGDHTVSLYKPKSPFFIATDGVKILSADKFNGKYLFAALERYKPKSQGYRRHFNILKNTEFYFTRNDDEQQKIGAFFQHLDNLITLHQRKLDDLKTQKKGLLQKMFPKKGADVPEVRFPGFTGTWEQRKLGDLAEIVRGASPRPIKDPKWFDNSSDIGWLRIADVTEQNGQIYHLEQHISKLGQEKTRVLTTSHLLLSIAASVGKPVINHVKTGVHDGFLIFLNPQFNINFMYHWFEMYKENWKRFGQPGSQVNLNSDLVKNQEIRIPNNDEQEKISSFFQQLDNLITLHQRKLEHLQLQKKGLLQQMFV
jgi:type I restriction enzyme S subunit